MTRRDWYCEDVLSGRIEVRKVWEDDQVLAFHHPMPTAEVHVVVILKKHIGSILDEEATDGVFLSSLIIAIQNVAHLLELDKRGFYIRSNAAADGVTPHLHWHVDGPGIP